MAMNRQPSLYRWDSSVTEPVKDTSPRLPFRRRSVLSEGANDVPHRPSRRLSQDPSAGDCSKKESKKDTCACALPSFLAPKPAGPRRIPPSRTNGFKEDVDLHQIALKPIHLDLGSGEVSEGMEQVLQEVVLDHHTDDKQQQGGKSVSVVFTIRRPGCGQCREHGMQLSELVRGFPGVSIMGVIKQTAGAHDPALLEFYTKYFSFPLYKDEGWNLFHKLGNKKLSLWKMITKMPELDHRFKGKGIRHIPFGGDWSTQGGVLIFDKEGKLRFVYYESFGKELDMDAIQWAIKEANKPTQVSGGKDQ